MDINFICTRKRREFGKSCSFVDFGPSLISEIDPNPELREQFSMVSTVDREIDNSTKMCAHEVNTLTYPTESRGMNHTEGGWPAAVDNTDEESMVRFKKKVEKDKIYVNTVKSLADFLENFIMENNSIDIYEEYFEGERIECDRDSSIRTVSTFHDLNASYRAVIDLSWEKYSTKFVAIYALKQGRGYPVTPCIDSYVWDIEDNIKPVYTLKPEGPMTVAEFSPTNSNLILSGYVSGQVALWDIRFSGHAQQLSDVISSHTEKVTGIKWFRSKQETAFFSASGDGRVMSWDIRNMLSPTEVVHLDAEKGDFPSLDQPYTVSCVEYDVSVPNKFMVGTEQGIIISFNRKYKEDKDKLISQYDCGNGPLLALERNAFYPQLFASLDAWSFKLWSDSVNNMPILNVNSHDGYMTDMAWSPTRASTLYVTKTSGILEIWDVPGKNKEALLNIRLDNEALFSVAVTESGNQVACGTSTGSIQLVGIPEYIKTCSELETELVKECVRESETIIGGAPRTERMFDQETECTDVEMDDEWWDPPDKAEDLYEEYKVLFKDFLSEKEE